MGIIYKGMQLDDISMTHKDQVSAIDAVTEAMNSSYSLNGLNEEASKQPYSLGEYASSITSKAKYPQNKSDGVKFDNIQTDKISFAKTNKDAHQALLDEIHDTYIRKNRDYGSSFSEQYKEYGLLSLIIRLDDKFRRLKQLNENEALVKESVEDTLLDAANYAIMGVMELRKQKEN
ncbi:hypothetical protein JOC34_000576 [Virgibacillus halotolerans]|uniref:nucleotide modification associated domain-containing protein n=1 Tax=Virgibacillus halotolerans TaxID=1071053 RepID=UPI001EF7C696|nr:nucleotide modification associated domain-containing protein [Virgibacillus halotolerans]MBM7598219.1 hypothetical protein [Virgibacillus halotolerans]